MIAEKENPPAEPHDEAGRELHRRLKQTQPFESDAQEAMLSLMVAGAAVRQGVEETCAYYDLSASHYNVLRILAGGPPEGHARCDIIERMIDRGPDVTRLMDRLERQGFVERRRSEEDGRVTLHSITEKGRSLLDDMHADIRGVQDRFADSLSSEDRRTLARLCAQVYGLKS